MNNKKLYLNNLTNKNKCIDVFQEAKINGNYIYGNHRKPEDLIHYKF